MYRYSRQFEKNVQISKICPYVERFDATCLSASIRNLAMRPVNCKTISEQVARMIDLIIYP